VKRPELALAGGSALAVLVLLLAAEGAVRLFAPRTAPADELSRLYRYSEHYGWEPRRSFRGHFDGRLVTTNRAGLRGPERSPTPAPGTFRIALMGDSVAFGFDVSDHETFARALEAKRANREVLNFAVQGYGTDQSLLRLEREGLDRGPRLVLLAFCLGNDFFDNALDHFLYDGRHPKPYFTLDDGELELHAAHLKLGPLQRAGRFLHEHSLLFARLISPAPRDGPHWRRTVLRLEERWPPLVRLAARLIGRMDAAVRSHGGELLVALFPYRRSWDGETERVDFLKRLLTQEERVAYVDMAEGFRERSLEFDAIAVDKLGHLNARGHAAAAAILDRALEGRDR
jgi:hypothetical protein